MATDIAVGSSLGEQGRYRLKKVLGTGGMASVWLATDARLRRPVAVKVLSDVLALDADFVARFEREARVAASLSHPHLVSVFDYSVHESRPYLVMEYVDGGTLAQRLLHPGGEEWGREILFGELLGALAYIHRAGIIHRDIKPANVLVGRDGRARITDFGIARPSGASRMTNTGLVLGTARYVAPEVLRGEPADQRSDLYACGVLFHECLRDGDPLQLYSLADQLSAERPELRPTSAIEALQSLDRPAQTGATRRLPPIPAPTVARSRVTRPTVAAPRVTRHGREVRVHLTRATALSLAGLALLALIVTLLSAGGGGSKPPATSTALPASAPLSQQLDRLDQAISHARR